MNYTKEFRENALKMAERVGVTKTSKELHVGKQTLYIWRKKANEAKGSQGKQESQVIQKYKAKQEYQEKQTNQENQIITPSSPEANQAKTTNQPLQLDLKRELEEQRTLNKTCRQTIEYLVDENTSLRRQCENLLKAISLISQRQP